MSHSYRVNKSRRGYTCDTCKSRHQKCNGAEPQCNNCELRGINCSYSKRALPDPPGGSRSIEPASTRSDSRLFISSSEYSRLYSQIFSDVVRGLNLDTNQSPKAQEALVHSRLSSAGLPSFYREVSTLVEEQATLNSRQDASKSNANSPPTDQIRELAPERHLEHARKILQDSLPPEVVSKRLLDLFFKYQNSIFYVCSRDEAQSQLRLMYKKEDQVTISWFCQMFLIFSVAAQFDDLDDADGPAYHEIGEKYMDDAIEENPQNTLWIVRAMLLLCFYQQPTKWTSIWIYLDTAIRGAQRFQLDVGHNQQKELSDEEYQEWRQVWLTVICFDRWVAVFLGRLPRIKESISRDPIFKGANFQPSREYCVIQSNVTILAIIAGNVLRDMYFSDEFSLSACRQHKNELDTWLANLPNPFRQQVDSGVTPDLSVDQAEAAFNLHFMLRGTWMLLTRPLLLKVIKSTMSRTGFTGPIVSAITSEAVVCIDNAFQLIKSAMTMLSMSLPPKRSFMPTFFLINAANIIALGAVWKRKQSGEGGSLPLAYDQSRELAAIDAATRVLDLCGHRNTFARKYSLLIKDLRQKLSRGLSTTIGDESSQLLAAPPIKLQSSAPYNQPVSGSPQFSLSSASAATSPAFPNWRDAFEKNSTSMSPLADGQMSRQYFASIDSLNTGFEPWSEQFEALGSTDKVSSYDSSALIKNSDELDFLDDIMQ